MCIARRWWRGMMSFLRIFRARGGEGSFEGEGGGDVICRLVYGKERKGERGHWRFLAWTGRSGGEEEHA